MEGKRFSCITNTFINIPKKQLDFLEEIKQVCKKYNLSISHEDSYGAFLIEEYDVDNIEWLRGANIAWE